MKLTAKQIEAMRKIGRGGYRLCPDLSVRYQTTRQTLHRNTYISLARLGLVQVDPVWRQIELTPAGSDALAAVES